MNMKSLVSALAAVAAIGLQAATTYTATEQYVQNVVKAESNRTDLAIGALRQEVQDAKYLTPSAIKAGANVSVTTNAAGEVTIAADGGVEADFTTNNTVLVTTIETVAPTPGNYAAVSNAAMNAAQSQSMTNYATRAEMDEGWWSEWTILRNGTNVTSQVRQPSWIPEGTIGPADTKVWFVGNSCISGDESTSAFLVHGPRTEYVGDLAWSAEDAVVESVSYTATRHRVAAPVPTKPSDIGAASTNDLNGIRAQIDAATQTNAAQTAALADLPSLYVPKTGNSVISGDIAADNLYAQADASHRVKISPTGISKQDGEDGYDYSLPVKSGTVALDSDISAVSNNVLNIADERYVSVGGGSDIAGNLSVNGKLTITEGMLVMTNGVANIEQTAIGVNLKRLEQGRDVDYSWYWPGAVDPTNANYGATLVTYSEVTNATTLTPKYSDNPTFSEWTFNRNNVSVSEPREISEGLWGYHFSGDELNSDADQTFSSEAEALVATELTTITMYGVQITATRTRTDIIGYTLGDQSDKKLQPMGDYATTADLEGIDKLTIVTQDTSLIFSTNDVGGAVFGGMRDAGGGGEIVVDQEIIEGSHNAVAGGAVYTGLTTVRGEIAAAAQGATNYVDQTKDDIEYMLSDYLDKTVGLRDGTTFPIYSGDGTRVCDFGGNYLLGIENSISSMGESIEGLEQNTISRTSGSITSAGVVTDYLINPSWTGGIRIRFSSGNLDNYTSYGYAGVTARRSGVGTDYTYDNTSTGFARLGDLVSISNLVNSKQDALVAGSNISITKNANGEAVISATGSAGGSGSIDIDGSVIEDSTHAVSGGAVWSSLQNYLPASAASNFAQKSDLSVTNDYLRLSGGTLTGDISGTGAYFNAIGTNTKDFQWNYRILEGNGFWMIHTNGTQDVTITERGIAFGKYPWNDPATNFGVEWPSTTGVFAVKSDIDKAVLGKQNKLVAGANITLVDNGDSTVTINSTGGGSAEADGTPEIVYKSNAIVNSTNTVVLTDNAYNNVTQGAESVLKIQIPASTGMRSRVFYLVYNCSNAGQTELFFDINTLVTKILVKDGDLTVFSPSVGTNIYKFEEIASDKFLLSRTVAVEL